jgi:hypothetical protein
MKLTQKFLQSILVFEPTVSKDDEGNQVTIWGTGVLTQAIVRPVNGQQAVTQYGTKLPFVKRLLENLNFFQEGVHEGWGVKISTTPEDVPEFKVISVQQYTDHTEILIEKM